MNNVHETVIKAKEIVNRFAEESKSFTEFEKKVRGDAALRNMVKSSVINILIQQHAHELD